MITRRHIFWLWFPLALSMTLMMLEGPAIQGAIARLPDPALNLAAFGLVLGIQLIIESPIIMLVSTAIALAKDAQSYRALRNFATGLNVGLTILAGVIAWTPLFDLIAGGLLGVPPQIVEAGRPAMKIMLFWTAAIGWRRFYQGILVRFGQSRFVTLGTAVRLASIVAVAVGGVVWGGASGASVGATIIMAGVAVEFFVTYALARGCVRGELLAKQSPPDNPLTTREIIRFHTPLAATSLLTLLVQPVTAAALARLAMPRETLAAWPVVFSTMLILRGWGLALQEITIAQAKDQRMLAPLRSFAFLVAAATSAFAGFVALTPLLELHLRYVIGLAPELIGYVRLGVLLSLLLPALTAMTSWLRGLFVAASATGVVYQGMMVNLLANASMLLLGVVLQLPGVPVAAFALTLAMLAEYAYLRSRNARLEQPVEYTPAPRPAARARPQADPSVSHAD